MSSFLPRPRFPLTPLVCCGTAAALFAAGCASSGAPPSKTVSGAGTGAMVGGSAAALAGVVAPNSAMNSGAAIVGGVAAGAIIGGAIGASMDEEDRRMAYAAEMQALESGAPGAAVGWRSQRTAYYGSVVPGPYYESGGRRCRQFTHTVFINGRPETARGTACRAPDGRWVAVG